MGKVGDHCSALSWRIVAGNVASPTLRMWNEQHHLNVTQRATARVAKLLSVSLKHHLVYDKELYALHAVEINTKSSTPRSY